MAELDELTEKADVQEVKEAEAAAVDAKDAEKEAEKKGEFDKELFKRSVLYNVMTMYRKTLEEATPQQIFQAASYSIKDRIIGHWMTTQKAYEKEDPKIVYYMSMEFLMGSIADGLTIFQNQNMIRIANRTDPLSDNHQCCIREMFFNSLAQLGICAIIQRAGRIVQNQNLRLRRHGTGNQNPLFLPSA